MKSFFGIVLFFVCNIFFACKNNARQNNSKLYDTLVADTSSQITTIANLFVDVRNSGFILHQDTLYFNKEKFNGYCYRLFPSKDTAFVGSYLNGLEEGVHKKWYPNKQLTETRAYHKGKKVAKHIGYWENGKIKFEFESTNGEYNGLATEWYKTGQVYKKFHYLNGYEEGSQKMWWENGVIRANYVVKNGRRYGLVGLKLCMNPNDSI